MKKTLKKTLLGLALVPCMFTAACFGGKDNNPPTTPTELTATEKNEAYTKFKTLVAQKKFTDTNSTASEMNISVKAGLDLNLDASGLNEAGKTIVKNAVEEDGEGMTVGYNNIMSYDLKEETGYKSDNTGYDRFTMEAGGLFLERLNGGGIKSVETEITKATGTGSSAEYTSYAKSEEFSWELKEGSEDEYEWSLDEESLTKTASLVDDKYVKNTYQGLKNEDMDDILTPAFEGLTEYDSYTDLVENFDKFANTVIAQTNSDMVMDDITYIPEDTKTTAELTLTDGVYTLTANIDIDGLDLPADQQTGKPATKADMDVNMTIKFDNDSIDFVDMDIKVAEKETRSTFELIDSYAEGGDENALRDSLQGTGNDEAIAEDTTGTVSNTNIVSMSIDINTQDEFDNTIMSENTTSYTGEGEEGAIVNRIPSITYVYGDNQSFEFALAPYNDTAWGEAYAEIDAADLGCYVDGATIKLYSDSAMTQEITSTSLVPSYDHEVYVKLSLPEGYATVLSELHNDSFGSISTLPPKFVETSELYDVTENISSFYTITKVTVNGVEIADYEEGLTLEDGKVYHIVVSYTSNFDF